MKTVRLLTALCVAGLATAAARAQEMQMPKPGPEFEPLKKLVGTWDCDVKSMGQESKGTMVYKMDLGGLWLVGKFEGGFGGMKFEGRSLDSYDARKGKYVSVWVDSMGTTPLVSEGTYDKEKKTMTMTGEGPGMDGKMQKMKMVTEAKDDDTLVFNMYMGGSEDQPMMTINYKRRK